MDSIRFEVFLDGPIEPILSREAKFARTIINERSILDIIEEYELSFLEQKQAGAYEYQFADTLYCYLTDKSFSRIGLLICGCLCEGCWPIYVTMEETLDWVIWKNFFNPHICGSHYYGIGPFRFAKSVFWNEVENLKHLIYSS